MPISSNNLLGLVIVSLGILGIIISFLVTEKKKQLISLALSGLVILTGSYYYVSIGLRQWRLNRRIAQLQEQQRTNFQAFQERLRQSQAQPPAAAADERPAAPRPASNSRR